MHESKSVRAPGRRLRRAVAIPAEAQTLTDKAYAQLEELIVTLQLPPGTTVSEGALARRLRIGRTPIREALQRLARERLVEIQPRRGVQVAEIDVEGQLRVLEFRREVERLLARSAARRANPETRARFEELALQFEASARTNDDIAFMRVDRAFNDLCLVAARNEFTVSAMGLTQSLSRRFWYQRYKQSPDMAETARLHADIARAIAAADEDGAAAATERLVDWIETLTRTALRSVA